MENLKNKLKKAGVLGTSIVGTLLALPLSAFAASGQAFFAQAIDSLGIIVNLIGAGFIAWGAINLAEGYGSDNPGSKSQGIKQMMAGGGIVLIGMLLVPQLAGFF